MQYLGHTYIRKVFVVYLKFSISSGYPRHTRKIIHQYKQSTRTLSIYLRVGSDWAGGVYLQGVLQCMCINMQRYTCIIIHVFTCIKSIHTYSLLSFLELQFLHLQSTKSHIAKVLVRINEMMQQVDK